MSPPQLQASVAPFSSASQNGDSTSFWLYLYSFYCYLDYLSFFSFFPATLLASAWPSGASLLLGLLAPAASWLPGLRFQFIQGFSCVEASVCLVIPAASSIPVALLPYGSESLIASAASWILSFKPSAASWISHSGFCLMVSVPHGSCYIVAPIASWLLCPFGPMLSCCFMASATLWPHVLMI